MNGFLEKSRQLGQVWGSAFCPSNYLHLKSREHVCTQVPEGEWESLNISEKVTYTNGQLLCGVHIGNCSIWRLGFLFPLLSYLGSNVNTETASWSDLLYESEGVPWKFFKQFIWIIRNIITVHLEEEIWFCHSLLIPGCSWR